MNDRETFLELIESNIKRYGYHVTIVNGKTDPRYAYTIGLIKDYGFELILAGGIYYLKDDLLIIFDSIVKNLRKRNGEYLDFSTEIKTLGSFSLSTVHNSWSKEMALGVFDFYKTNQVKLLQIKPDVNHYTLDIPDMSKERGEFSEPVWKWLDKNWDLPVPSTSSVATNLKALQGEKITEVMRCEEDEWEMFSIPGPEVQKEEMRVVPLGTLLGIDKSLYSAVNLEIGKGIWRDSGEEQWNKWG